VIPFRGINDPNRLDHKNLQTLCRRCHNEKTAKQRL
jgi:5-methylcytosine-specific restriction endonuclease McrA